MNPAGILSRSSLGLTCREVASRTWARLAVPILWLMAAISTQAHPGIGIVMDRRNNVFYTDLTHVWRIAPDGTKSIAVRDVHTHELCLDGDGNLYGEHLWYEGEAANRWWHYTWKLSPDGKLQKSPPQQGFRRDASFVRDAGGNMYWFSPAPPAAFIRRAPNGNTSRLGGQATYRDVRWITATSHGDVYFTDDGDLRRLATDGTVITLAPNVRERASHWIGGVWLDVQGRVYVAVWGASVVKRFDPHSRRVDVVARSAAPWGPSGGMVAPNGDLWLLETSETNTVRVRRISPSGVERIF